MASCRTVDIEIAPLYKVVTPVYKRMDNDLTQMCDFNSDSPACSHRYGLPIGTLTSFKELSQSLCKSMCAR